MFSVKEEREFQRQPPINSVAIQHQNGSNGEWMESYANRFEPLNAAYNSRDDNAGRSFFLA